MSYLLKPKGVECRRAALLGWTGWSEKELDAYIDVGTIHPIRRKKKINGQVRAGRCWYNVDEVERVLHGAETFDVQRSTLDVSR